VAPDPQPEQPTITREMIYRAAQKDLELTKLIEERHAAADAEWDVTEVICARLKNYAKKDCIVCRGEGRTGLIMEPVFLPSPLSINKSILVGHVPKPIPCKCTNFVKNEYRRLHRENVSASQIAIDNVKATMALAERTDHLAQLEMAVLAEIADTKRLMPFYWIRAGWLWAKSKLTRQSPPPEVPGSPASPTPPADNVLPFHPDQPSPSHAPETATAEEIPS
jgi:hypothetical protein